MHDRAGELLRLAQWLAEQDPPRTLLTATADDLAAWQRSISRMAIESICTYVAHVRGFYTWLARFRHEPDITGLLTRPKVPRRLPRPIPDESLATALQAATGKTLIILLLMCMCGLRCGEIARLRRPDIQDRQSPPVVVVAGKGGQGEQTRVVPMAPGLAEVLRAAGLPLVGFVVTGADGRAMSPARVSQVTNDHLHELGIPETAHSLRHWFGTYVYRQTGDIRLVQEMMGHASPATTAPYTAFAPAHADDMAADLDKAMRDLLGRPGKPKG